MARPEGFEPPAFRIGICCDIQLRYGRMMKFSLILYMPRSKISTAFCKKKIFIRINIYYKYLKTVFASDILQNGRAGDKPLQYILMAAMFAPKAIKMLWRQ